MSRKQSGGFALIYAIVFVGAVSAMSVGLFTVVKNFYDRRANIELESQYFRILKDFPTTLEQKLSKIKNESDFEYFILYNTEYEFSSGELKIKISAKPIKDKMFFSDVFDVGSGNVREEYSKMLSQTLDFYGIKYKSLFLSMLQDSIDADRFERELGSELSARYRNFQDGEIESYDDLKRIIEFYKLETGDKNIDSIDWRVFFNFYKKPAKYFVDCKIMAPEVYSIVSAYTGEGFYDCAGITTSKNFEKFKKSFSIISFDPRSPYSFLVDVNISKNKTQNLEKKFIYESGSKQITFLK